MGWTPVRGRPLRRTKHNDARHLWREITEDGRLQTGNRKAKFRFSFTAQFDLRLKGADTLVNNTPDPELVRYWSGLAILERLLETGSELTSEQVGTILGTKNVKGIGSALRQTKFTLSCSGIRLDEAVSKRSVHGRTIWVRGPRIEQAVHVLEQERYRWEKVARRDTLSVANSTSDSRSPVLVLRSLKLKKGVFRIVEGMQALDELLEDEWFDVGEGQFGGIGEIFIDSIESGEDGRVHSIPDGYEENGIWIRGQYDYSQPRVAGAIGTGRFSTMIACIVEATWVERRVPLVDAIRQVKTAQVEERRLLPKEGNERWHDVEGASSLLYVEWIGARGISGPRSAPPLRMRLRCWYEIVIETSAGKRTILREEGLRCDDQRTIMRATNRWRELNAGDASEPVIVREFRIAKRQPRPMP